MILHPHIDLGERGIAYVRWSLSHSPSTLASLLLQKIPLDGGHVFAFKPVHVDAVRLHDFHDGVLGQTGASEVRTWVYGFVVTYLQDQGRRYFVVEDVNSQATDPWLRKSTAQYVTHSQEVYQFLGREHPSPEAVSKTVAYAKGYVTNSILTAGAGLPILRTKENLAVSQLLALADRADYILSEAYDGEGFVIWTKE